ncbi:potassium channel family protein [Thermococcus sp.]
MAFAYFEDVNFFTALYWAVIRMATIGYGDVTPKSEAGRIVAMVASVAESQHLRPSFPSWLRTSYPHPSGG